MASGSLWPLGRGCPLLGLIAERSVVFLFLAARSALSAQSSASQRTSAPRDAGRSNSCFKRTPLRVAEGGRARSRSSRQAADDAVALLEDMDMQRPRSRREGLFWPGLELFAVLPCCWRPVITQTLCRQSERGHLHSQSALIASINQCPSPSQPRTWPVLPCIY
jgi:hypothetical protein